MANILIVDDSEALRAQLRKDLQTHGHTILEAFDGLDGLAQLKRASQVNLIICDVNMPNMDGLTMCSHVKSDAQFSNVSIFMLTTEANAEMKARGKEVGIKAWVTKPYSLQKLLTAIDKVCPK